MDALVLVVEDESDLAQSLEYNLKREGFRTRLAHTGRQALVEAARSPLPDLVLLDLMLPDVSGKEVCRSLRNDPLTAEMAVIMVTARGEEVDRIVGLELGADDYVTKPYSVRELMLRIQAVLKRSGRWGESTDSVCFGVLEVDSEAHRVTVAGDEAPLTALEFRLLKLLLDRRGRVQSRDVLLERVWGVHADSNTRTVDTHVKRLRQKLGVAGEYVETIRGVGYRFRSEP